MDSSFKQNTAGPDTRVKGAFYGRNATDTAQGASIDDQFRRCLEFAESRGWEIDADHIYGDVGRSGVKQMGRVGLEALKTAARKYPRPFECILFEDLSRLGRNQADVLSFTRLMKFHGIKVYFINQKLDSSDKNFEILLNVLKRMNEGYSDALRTKVFRGQKARVLQGFHIGSVPYGYKALPAAGATSMGSKLEIAEEQAVIVRRIFHLFADGHAVAAIRDQLNDEGIPSRRKVRSGQVDAAWSHGAISRILRNPIFRGEMQWNVSCRSRQPLTGKMKRGIKPAHEHVRVPAEHLRIVDDALWFEAAERLKRINDKKMAVFTAS
jgi:site-specific DNA recombinase